MSQSQKDSLSTVESWVRAELEAAKKRAHGWLHTNRVRHNILILAPAEGVDPFLAELAALIHDVGRTQPGPENEHGARSATLAAPVLAALPLSKTQQQAVLYAARWHNSTRADTPLLCVLRDADMLDGLGAVGIVRAFMSKSHLPAYQPDFALEGSHGTWPPTCASDQVWGQLRFYDWLNTDTARQLAQERFSFMQAFMVQLQREISGSGE
jgi:uncharacterized protein